MGGAGEGRGLGRCRRGAAVVAWERAAGQRGGTGEAAAGVSAWAAANLR